MWSEYAPVPPSRRVTHRMVTCGWIIRSLRRHLTGRNLPPCPKKPVGGGVQDAGISVQDASLQQKARSVIVRGGSTCCPPIQSLCMVSAFGTIRVYDYRCDVPDGDRAGYCADRGCIGPCATHPVSRGPRCRFAAYVVGAHCHYRCRTRLRSLCAVCLRQGIPTYAQDTHSLGLDTSLAGTFAGRRVSKQGIVRPGRATVNGVDSHRLPQHELVGGYDDTIG